MRRRYRLRRTEDFQLARQAGKSWPNQFFVLVTCPNQLAHSRFGFVVSRHLGNSVQRNLIKRRLREAVRRRQEAIETGWDLVLIARHPIRDATYQEIERALADALRRCRLINSVPERNR
jgi:ribonuclease P protein component